MHRIVAILSGLLFGAGLSIGGMTDPARVRAFLDIFGAWDPTLAFVMGGALLVMGPAWLVQRRMDRAFDGTGFDLPDTRIIDRRLLGGSALFGIGWGIAGLCPGPAIASLATAFVPALVFVAAMIAGMLLHRFALKP
ncbi:MAG: DUF6691 family protein [Erythrobacter sp.]|jgi:hypothetical protein